MSKKIQDDYLALVAIMPRSTVVRIEDLTTPFVSDNTDEMRARELYTQIAQSVQASS